MPIYSYKNIKPKMSDGIYIAPSADLIGDIKVGANTSFWFQTVTRADVNHIEIGENTNIQDLSMLHVSWDYPLIVGSNVTIGHQVTLHACTIGDSCLIGMGAVILDGAEIGKNCLVAAGSVVPPGKKYPDGSFIIGNPAKVKRELTSEEIQKYGDHYLAYIKEKNIYLEDVCEILELDK